MRLPTLNVDVAVNTSGMKKDVARANKELQQIGGKGLALAGGAFGKVGSLASLGGTMGSSAVALGGAALAVAGPIMAIGRVTDSYLSAVKEAEGAMQSFAKTGKTGGMNIAAAMPLAAAGAKMGELQKRPFFQGLGEAFFAGGSDIYGNQGGLLGFLQEIPLLLKGMAAGYGAFYSGKGYGESYRQFMMHSSESQGGAMSFMTQDELKQLSRMMAEQTRTNRETTT